MKQNLDLHTSVRPYLRSEINELTEVDLLLLSRFGSSPKKNRSWLYRKLYQEHLLQYSDSLVSISADILFDLAVGKERNGEYLFTNTRGVQLQGDLGKQFSFYTAFYENQAHFPDYISGYIKKRRVVPGQGMARFGGENEVDYAIPYGYISYTPNQYVNFQFGQDKNFLGDGYRSLILSDFAYNYPFFKISTRFWKIKYVNLWAQYMDISEGFKGPVYPKKYAAYQYLSFLPIPKLNISIFQSMIWAPDTSGAGGINLAYLNPIIFANSMNFNQGSPANVTMGFNIRYDLLNSVRLYGQFILDDFHVAKLQEGDGFFQQKYGYQVGVKAFDVFGLPNLFAQAEFNTLRPYVHGHKDPRLANAHFNEALAHPLGANFKEWVLIGAYRYRRAELSTKLVAARFGADSAGLHYGKDIFRSDYEAPRGEFSFGNFTGQGTATNLYHLTTSFSYLLNPATNMQLEVGHIYRKEFSSLLDTNTQLFYFGLKTALTNRYYDF
ncbi:hypothetical protein [Nafulsella turpanensis]|uniref:hypothetical protein n=1 Tax=Nafulsella turpanensis TaxID=1265690 RepID=UPI0003683481|nr:hypothetical protein [Nafulsella turpanensis]